MAFYVPASVASLLALSRLWRPIAGALSPGASLILSLAGALLYFPGLALVLWGRAALGEMYDVSSSFGAQLFADHRLVTSGPYALMRHPMYVGAQMAIAGALLIFRTRAMAVMAMVIPVVWMRALREEEALAVEFGPRWTHYTRSVPFWPLWPRSG